MISVIWKTLPLYINHKNMKKCLFVLLSASFILEAFPQSNENEGGCNCFEDRSKTGRYNIMQVSLLIGSRDISSRANYVRDITPSFTIINGRRYNERWAAGFGFGYEVFTHHLVPVFVDVRKTRRDNDVSPFYAFKLGYSIGNIFGKHYDELHIDYQPFDVWDVEFKNFDRIMIHPEIGIKIPLSAGSDLLFTVAYRYQRMKTVITQKGGQSPQWTHKEGMNRLSLGVAFMFR